MSNIIYQDDLFTFTDNDIYCLGKNTIYFYVDISKYFNLRYSSFKNVKKFSFFHAKTRKKHLLFIGYTKRRNCAILPQLLADEPLSNILSVSYNKTYNIKLIPGDYIAKGAVPHTFNVLDYTCAFKNIIATGMANKMHITNKHYRSGHQDMSVSKQFHRLHNSMEQLYKTKRCGDTISEPKKKYKQITTKNLRRLARHSNIVYRKAKPLTDIYSRQIINNPLAFIHQSMFNTLYTKVSNTKLLADFELLLSKKHFNFKKEYRFIRTLFVFIMLGKYELAERVLASKAIINDVHVDLIYTDNIKSLTISKKTMNNYKRLFDSLYYRLSKYTYKDLFNTSPSIIDDLKSEVAYAFKDYSPLNYISIDKFTYVFCPKIIYSNTKVNQPSWGYGIQNTNRSPKTITIIKPKFRK